MRCAGWSAGPARPCVFLCDSADGAHVMAVAGRRPRHHDRRRAGPGGPGRRPALSERPSTCTRPRRWARWWCRLPRTRTGQRAHAGAPDSACGDRQARAGAGRPRDYRARRSATWKGAQCGGAPGRVGRQAAGVPSDPARLAGRGRSRTSGAGPPGGEVVREHDHVGDRLAAGGLHRHHTAAPVRRSGAVESGWQREAVSPLSGRVRRRAVVRRWRAAGDGSAAGWQVRTVSAYVGSGPYCYANTLSMVVEDRWRPACSRRLTRLPVRLPDGRTAAAVRPCGLGPRHRPGPGTDLAGVGQRA